MSARRWALLAVLAVALLLLAGRILAGVYVDYRWYEALGAASLWSTKAFLTALLDLASGGAAALFVFANLYAVRHSVVSIVLPRRVGNVEIGQEVPGSYLVGAAVAIAIVAGTLLTLPNQSWMSLALSRHGLPFGETDPYFEADLGFFVYWLPLENALHLWALITLLVAAALVIFLYALTPSMRWQRGSLYVSNWVRRHLVVLGAILLLVIAWGDRLGAYRVLIHGSGASGTFTFSDHHAAIPVSVWLSILTVGIAFVVLIFGWNGQLRVAFVSLTILLVLSLALRQLGPVVARRASGIQNVEAREAPYRQLRADYSRRAYAVDRVVDRGRDTATGESPRYAAPGDAIGAVAIWDAPALERAVGASQTSPGVTRGVGWAPSLPALEGVVLSEHPRVDAASGELDERRSTWLATRVLAAAADDQGLPIVLPRTPGGADTQPDTLPTVLIYDSVPGYTVVTDPSAQVAAPSLASGFSRLAHAWGLQNFRLLSSDLAPTRVVSRRGVRERVGELVPFFVQGTSVRPVVAADSLYWIVDLYAASEYYPLSEHYLLGTQDYSYLHYAAVATVNAHTGVVSVLPEGVPGPIVSSWMRLFPSMFASSTTLPAQLLAAIPPATDGARAQAEMLARYGGRGQAQPMGRLPWNDGADSVLRRGAEPLYQLPRGTLVWSQAVLDSTDRIAGLVLRTAGQYGVTEWLPIDSGGTRWNTLLEQLHQVIDSSLTLPANTRMVRGPVRAIPIGNSVALVQPAYRWKNDGAPTLARVAVARAGAATAGATLAGALGVAEQQPAGGAGAPAGAGDFRTRVRRLYEQMREALHRGDWEAFGRAYDALGRLIASGTP
ncbi:MAG TPA: UPF0182 family protein [Gemmatimonadaceae bacterium]|nr:UPF0182 family protein [Gemmatimonadaceae bacterium]